MDYKELPANELVSKCAHSGDAAAWQEFIRRFNPLITSVVLRVSRQWNQSAPDLIEDLIQDTYLKLCTERFRVLKEFKSGHPDAIYGFIKVFTANVAQHHFKACHAQKRGGLAETTSLDAEATAGKLSRKEFGVETFDRNLLVTQVAACLDSVCIGPNAKRDRLIFWLYFRVGLSASAIAALPTIGLGVKGVESTLLRLTRQVRERLVNSKVDKNNVSKSGEGNEPNESFYEGED